MKTSCITCISKILAGLCFTKQKLKTEKSKFVYSVLVVKMY